MHRHTARCTFTAAAGAGRHLPGADGALCLLPLLAKCTAKPPIVLPQLVPGVTYLELMEHVRQLYPAAGPFVLKFVDK